MHADSADASPFYVHYCDFPPLIAVFIESQKVYNPKYDVQSPFVQLSFPSK